MATLGLADLQPLLAQFAGTGIMLSCYADMGVTEGFKHDWLAPFQADSDVLWKMIGEDGRARQEIQSNLTLLRRTLEESKGVRWLAAFSSTSRDFFKTFALDAPVATGLVMAQSPYLVPLLGAMHRRREYLAVQTDTHHARLFSSTMAGTQLLGEIQGEVPRKQHSSGERWGKEQATIARYRDVQILHYQKDLVQRIEHEWAGHDYSGIALLGEHEVVEHVRKALPARLAERVVHTGAEPWQDRPAHLERELSELVGRLVDAEEAKVAEGFWDRLREGRAIAKGPRGVLEKIEAGGVGPEGYGCLVFGPDTREVVGRCTVCRALALDDPAKCPRCGSPCAEGNLWEELMLLALRHKIAVRFVKDPAMLAPHGGVVAVLPKA